MGVQEIRLNKTLAYQVDPFTFNANLSAQDIIIYTLNTNFRTITNSFTIDSSASKIQAISFYPSGYILRSFRAFVNIISIEAVQPIEIALEDTQQTIITKNNENDSKYPYYWLYLEIKQGSRRTTVGQFRLQNKRPGYYINLLPFLANNEDFLADSQTEILVSIQDSGWGLPGADDIISFYGELEEIGYIADLQQSQDTVNNVLSGQITVNNSSSNGNTITNLLKLNLLGSIPTMVRVYYVPSSVSLESGVVDLYQYNYEEFSPSSEITVTSFLETNSGGYYIIAPILDTVSSEFWTVPAIELVANPTDRANILFGYFIDSSLNYTQQATLYCVHVSSLPVSIIINWN